MGAGFSQVVHHPNHRLFRRVVRHCSTSGSTDIAHRYSTDHFHPTDPHITNNTVGNLPVRGLFLWDGKKLKLLAKRVKYQHATLPFDSNWSIVCPPGRIWCKPLSIRFCKLR